jgi:hypothetical protein
MEQNSRLNWNDTWEGDLPDTYDWNELFETLYKPCRGYDLYDYSLKHHFEYLLRERGTPEYISRPLVRKLMKERNDRSKHNKGFLYKYKLRPEYAYIRNKIV